MKDMDREYCFVINLNAQLQPLNCNCVSIGGLNRAMVPVANVFKSSILSNAGSIIMLHNHPSGSTDPSPEDIEITRTLRESGQLIGIPLIDHVIVSSSGKFSSLREYGYFPDDGKTDGVCEKKADYAVEQRNKLKALTDQLDK